jgi:hypothetical protein
MLEQKQDFICVMYNSASTSEAISVIADMLDVIILAITTTGPIAFALKTAMLLLFNSDTLNRLYEDFVDINYPDADCSDCCAECTPEDDYILDLSSGWVIDNQFSGQCVIIDNQGSFSFTQGATLDMTDTYPGNIKFFSVSQEVEPFNLVQNTMNFEFTVLSEAVSCYLHVIFSDGTCEGHGPGTAAAGSHVVSESIDPANFCKTVTHFVFSIGCHQDFDPATVSITSAELTCEESAP